MTALIDELLPHWHFHEVHRVRIDAPTAVVMHAAMELTWDEVPAARALMRLTRNDLTTYKRVMGDIANRLAEADDEVVFGGVGSPTGPPPLAEPVADSFRAFAEPGHRKTVMNIRYAGGVLSTETRVLATDPATRRTFHLYWVVIRLFSGFIRRAVLSAVRRRVRRERSPR